MVAARRQCRLRLALESAQIRFLTRFSPGETLDEQDTEREKGIWQRRYWEHAIRNDIDLERHVDYIHYNPKHGLVTRVAD